MDERIRKQGTKLLATVDQQRANMRDRVTDPNDWTAHFNRITEIGHADASTIDIGVALFALLGLSIVTMELEGFIE